MCRARYRFLPQRSSKFPCPLVISAARRSLVIFLVSLGIRLVARAMPHFAHAPRLAVGWFKRRSVVLACSLCWLGRQSPTLSFVCCGCASGGASVLLSCRVTWHTARAWCVWCVWARDTHARRYVVLWWPLGHRGNKKTQQTHAHSSRTPPRII